MNYTTHSIDWTESKDHECSKRAAPTRSETKRKRTLLQEQERYLNFSVSGKVRRGIGRVVAINGVGGAGRRQRGIGGGGGSRRRRIRRLRRRFGPPTGGDGGGGNSRRSHRREREREREREGRSEKFGWKMKKWEEGKGSWWGFTVFKWRRRKLGRRGSVVGKLLLLFYCCCCYEFWFELSSQRRYLWLENKKGPRCHGDADNNGVTFLPLCFIVFDFLDRITCDAAVEFTHNNGSPYHRK